MASLRLVEVAQRSDTGLVRAHNEDRSMAVDPLLVVADGMGGAKAGEVAAQMTVDALAHTGPAPGVEQVLEAIADANREIRELSLADPDHAGMGTTVTAALLHNGGVTVLHVGDSRAYVIRGTQIRQVTDDHSLVGELMRQGQLTADEAERHPSRNIITRALGAEPDVAVDKVPLALEPGDVLLLCSDGLSTMIVADDIVRIVTGARDLRTAADGLVQAALAAGGTDNVTVILGRVDGGTGPADDTTDPPLPEATMEIPAVAEPVPTIESADLRDESPTEEIVPSRPVAVLESASRSHMTRLRRALWIVGVALATVIGLGAWAGSRTFYVDATDGATTARIYHGPPFSLLGVELSREWADTGVDAALVRSGDPTALSGNAQGQGAAVTKAARLVWQFGLPDVATLQLPPTPPATDTKTATGTK